MTEEQFKVACQELIRSEEAALRKAIFIALGLFAVIVTTFVVCLTVYDMDLFTLLKYYVVIASFLSSVCLFLYGVIGNVLMSRGYLRREVAGA